MNRKDRGALHSLAVFNTKKNKNIKDRKHINKKKMNTMNQNFMPAVLSEQ